MRNKGINFKAIERKWQKKWADGKLFEANEGRNRKKFYVSDMFIYPSASYLHMGHVRNYGMGDLTARYRRMKGFNVLYPVGFDAFGLPAENAAIKEKIHPAKYTEGAIKKIKTMMREIGFSYDWSREISTHEPEYYKWNQWIFLRMYEKGIAYRKEAPVNWCPSCNTTLANDEVVGGKCWRCDSGVTVKQLEQWFLKVTDYAEELLKELDSLDWPLRLKELQRNWIGRSEGAKVTFAVKNMDKTIEVFTTRADTIFGTSFIVCAANHPMAEEFVKGTRYEKKYREFLRAIGVSASEKLPEESEKEKEGFFTGRYAIHPLTGEELPIYTANFVVFGYGTGAVMGVPAHDGRDYEFAKKYRLKIKRVVESDRKDFYEGEGKLMGSDVFTGLESGVARERIIDALSKKGVGSKSIEYKLRDWLVSRQRYWGTPIPIVYCGACGVVPVPEKSLPVLLPEKAKFTGTGNPLAANKDFVNVKCPNCGSDARRETDTMSTFFDSSWYFLRYCSPHSHDIFDRKNVGYWMPIDQYIGGIEHATGHLLYARFFTKFLRDIGWLLFGEPFTKVFNQGFVLKNGEKMSKSRGNTITPEEVSNKYGIDTARFFLLFVGSPEKDIEWDEHGIEGCWRVVNKFIGLTGRVGGISDGVLEHKLNKIIKIMAESYEKFEFNKGLVAFVEFIHYLSERDKIPRHALEILSLIIAPVMPHIAEEVWSKLGRATLLAAEDWPKADESKINPELDEDEKKIEQVISDIANIMRIVKEKQNKEIRKIYVYAVPNEVSLYDGGFLSARLGKEVIVFAVNDKSKHDPQGKAEKAKPGKPGIYAE